MEDFNYIYKNERKWIGILKDVYTVEFFECTNDTYELEIYDDTGVYHYPREFMECTSGVNSVKFNPVDGYWAVNLTKDDVNAFFDAIIKYNKANQRR